MSEKDFAERLISLRKDLNLSQEQMGKKIGLSGSYVYQLESRRKSPSDSVITVVRMLEDQLTVGLLKREERTIPIKNERPRTEEDPTPYRHNRRIRVVSWAHAGQAVSYEEIPETWQDEIVTDCRDEHAFALRLEGDSMESKGATSFTEGDLIITMPSKKPYSGCYVVCRFEEDGGILFRRLETVGSTIRLIPLNERYNVTEHQGDEFSWIYPVWGRWSQLWKG